MPLELSSPCICQKQNNISAAMKFYKDDYEHWREVGTSKSSEFVANLIALGEMVNVTN